MSSYQKRSLILEAPIQQDVTGDLFSEEKDVTIAALATAESNDAFQMTLLSGTRCQHVASQPERVVYAQRAEYSSTNDGFSFCLSVRQSMFRRLAART